MSLQVRSRLIGLMVVMVMALMVVACVPAGASSVAAQAPVPTQVIQGVESVPGRQISVVGTGEAFGQPDEAQVQIGVETFSPTVAEATSENQATLEAVMAALDEAGIPASDIQTSNYGVWAEQIYGDRGPEGIAGYRVSNMVTVIVRDITQVAEVLGAVTDAGANAIHGVTFSVADTAALQAEARAEAMADAEARAQSLAELAGVELGEPLVISEVIGQPMPFPMGGGYAVMESAAVVPSISPGQLSYQMQVQVVYAMK